MSVPLVKKKVDHQTLFLQMIGWVPPCGKIATLSTLPALQYIVIQPFFMVSYEGGRQKSAKVHSLSFSLI